LATIEEIARQLKGRQAGNGWSCLCPSHDDSEPSLSLWENPDGSLGVMCYAGCERDDIMAVLAKRDLWDGTAHKVRGKVNGAGKHADLLKQLVPVEKSPAAAYLAGRGITALPPPTVLYQPAARKLAGKTYGAMVGLAYSDGGVIQGYQQLFLDDGEKAPLKVQRKTTGKLDGAGVLLPGHAPICVTEGVEDALSVWQATGNQTIAALGQTNIGRLKIPAGTEVIVVLDHDPPDSQAAKASAKQLNKLRRQGVKVLTCRPALYDGEEKTDINDVLQRDGEEAVRKLINEASTTDPNESAPPPPGADDAEQAITDINKRYFVIKDGNKTVVAEECWDEAMDRRMHHMMSFTAFRDFFSNQQVLIGFDAQGNPQTAKLGSWWLAHSRRRQFERLVFVPKGDAPPDHYNLWQGFRVDPVQGSWDTLKDHILMEVCHGVKEHAGWVLDWMAHAVQEPDKQAEVAMVLQGKRGVGKGILARALGHLFGQHFLHVSQPKHILGHFNQHLRDCVLLFADEAFWAGDKQGEGVLKTIITEPTLTIEGKGRDVVQARNMLHIIVASNNEWVVPAGLEERRFAVFEVSDKKMQDRVYFGKIQKELTNGGYEAMLHELMHRDYSGRDIRDVPMTRGLVNQKLESLPPELGWWLKLLREGELPAHCEWGSHVVTASLHQAYIDDMKELGINRRLNQVHFTRRLRRMIPDTASSGVQLRVKLEQPGEYGQGEVKRAWGYTIEDLEGCRIFMEQQLGKALDWDAVTELDLTGMRGHHEEDIPF